MEHFPDLKYFSGYFKICLYTVLGTFLVYLGTGTIFHWLYYQKKRGSAENWKCQPYKWSTPQHVIKDILLGSFTTLWATALWAALATYVINGGEASQIYFNLNDASYIWLFMQVPVVFTFMDYIFYWQHRMFHVPWMYKRFHKVHHANKQPTVFSAHVFHPLEHITELAVIFSPVFLVPIYWINMLVIYTYLFVHGILSHSGINFSLFWWQPWHSDTKYHDLHHQCTHGNYAFFITLWDQLHGTAITTKNVSTND